MNKNRFKTIRSRILLFMLPIAVVSMLVLSLISYRTSFDLINTEIDQKMNYVLDQTVTSIQKSLYAHSRVAEALARTVEVTGTTMTKEQYVSILKSYTGINSETLGAGVWFEPYKYSPDMKYFGPYAYKDNGEAVYTEDYSTPEYDYPSYDWYKNGMGSDKSVIWSVPYYDEVSQITMVTTTAPFYDGSRNFLGVTTADIDLSTLQKMIDGIRIGETGRVFLLDQSGLYIADADREKIMKANVLQDPDKSLAAIGKDLIGGKRSQGEFGSGGGKSNIYYAPIPETGWTVAVVIPQKELYRPLDSLMRSLLIVAVIMLAVMVLFVTLFGSYIERSVRKILELGKAMGSGDLTHKAEIRSSDELGEIARSLNGAVDNTRELAAEIIESATEISAASQELSASAEELSARLDHISQATDQISRGTEELSSTTEEISASSEEISSSTTVLSDRADDTRRLSGEIRTRAADIRDKGREAMNNISAVLDEKQKEIVKAIEAGKAVEEVKVMAESIAGIAAQTNLLALNAAIEAARAGESGKGFAVVADEVRKLAEQSSQAVNKIYGMVGQVQEAFDDISQNAGDLLDIMENKVRSDYKLLVETGESYLKDAEAVSNFSEEIARATKAMADRLSEVNGAIENMAATAQESAAGSQEITDNIHGTSAATVQIVQAAQGQAQLAEKLNHMVMKFKIV